MDETRNSYTKQSNTGLERQRPYVLSQAEPSSKPFVFCISQEVEVEVSRAERG